MRRRSLVVPTPADEPIRTHFGVFGSAIELVRRAKLSLVGAYEIPIRGGTAADHLGRRAVRFDERTPTVIASPDVDLVDGTIQVDLALSGERCFPGLAFRVNGDDYESFFVRPHQSGNPDAVHRSRDYRFLGSIGYWDTVFLPLAQGDNELVVAVSESFGGWGVQARFQDPTGITFKR